MLLLKAGEVVKIHFIEIRFQYFHYSIRIALSFYTRICTGVLSTAN